MRSPRSQAVDLITEARKQMDRVTGEKVRRIICKEAMLDDEDECRAEVERVGGSKKYFKRKMSNTMTLPNAKLNRTD